MILHSGVLATQPGYQSISSSTRYIMKQSTLRTLFQRIVLLAFILVCTGLCILSASAAGTNATPSGVTQVEVYHFHPTNGCRTCTAIGDYAEETVMKYYPAELESKKLVFDHVNFQDLKNADLVKKFEGTGSSLMIGVTNDTGFHKEEDVKVWYKTGNKDEFMTYLKDLLDRRFLGSLE